MRWGTILEIHALERILWIAGLAFKVVHPAPCRNAFAEGIACFQDSGRMMVTIKNRGGVLSNVSCSSSDRCRYPLPC